MRKRSRPIAKDKERFTISNPQLYTRLEKQTELVAVATKDRIINPDLERWYATRAHGHKIEVVGASHPVYTSRPKEVAALIEDAATHAR